MDLCANRLVNECSGIINASIRRPRDLHEAVNTVFVESELSLNGLLNPLGKVVDQILEWFHL